MRKTVTPVVSVILLSLMTVGASILAFVWINSVQSNVQEGAGLSAETAPGSSSTRLQIISVRGDGAVVQNVGNNPVDSVTLLIDGTLEDYNLGSPLNPGSATLISFTQTLTAGVAHSVGVVSGGSVSSTINVDDEDAIIEAGYTTGGGEEGNYCDNIQAVFRSDGRIFGQAGNINELMFLGHNYTAPAGSTVRRVDFYLPYGNTSNARGSGNVNVYITDNSIYSTNPSSLTPDATVFVQNSSMNKWVNVSLNIPVSGEFFLVFQLENTTYWQYSDIPFSYNISEEYSTLICQVGNPAFDCATGIKKYEELAGFALAFNVIVHVSTSETYGDLCTQGYYCSLGECSKFLTNVGGCDTDDDCTGDDKCCNNVCIDTTYDESNCGACGVTCTGTQFCDSGTPTECGGCDGICLSPDCYGIDSECNELGYPTYECCGNDVCGLGETCFNCPGDCGICYYSLANFSDGSSEKLVYFPSSGTNTTAKVRINSSADVNSALVKLSGLFSNQYIQGENEGDSFGVYLTSGDINNDNYDDLIVSPSEGDKVYMFWGSSTGITSTNNITLSGENSGDYFGMGIATGDINNDNYDELIVIASKYGVNEEGRAYIFWGNTTGSFTNQRNYTIDGTGFEGFGPVSVGDVNNDNYIDVILNERNWTDTTTSNTYVFWGNATNDFTNERNYTISFEIQNFGGPINTGDFNGDGYDDIVIGGQDSGKYTSIKVFWGNATNDFSQSRNYNLFSETVENYGLSISSGDINNDNYDELIMGLSGNNSYTGMVSIYWGSVSGINSENNMTLTGEGSNNLFGASSLTGKVNNDNYNDLIIGAQGYGPDGEGRAYIYWGSSTGITSTNYSSLTGESWDGFGTKLSIADLNNDNNNELIISSPSGPSQSFIGLVHVFNSDNSLTSPTLKPGSNAGTSWGYTGSFFDSATANMTDELNSILPSCSCLGCSLAAGYCTIDLNISSTSAGNIQLTNLMINYTLS